MDKYIIQFCSPTLAGIKTGNMFSYTFTSIPELTEKLSDINETLSPKGVHAEAVCIRKKNALILIYRSARLHCELGETDVRVFLNTLGYHGSSIDDYLLHLKSRFLVHDGFPHEIGVFLGYPLHDVIGFIENNGKNFKHTGCWKVYCDERESVKLFAQFNKCREVYKRLFLQGSPIERLVVVAN